MYTREEREGILWEFHRSGLPVGEACDTLPLFPNRDNLRKWLRMEEAGEYAAREMPDRLARMHCSHGEGSPAYRRGRATVAPTGRGGGRPTLADTERHAGQTDWRDWGSDLPDDPAERARMAEVKLAEAIMREEGLVARKTRQMRRRARYSSYAGERGERPPNLPLREDGTHGFSAGEPGLLVVTDVTEFPLDGFRAYLSPAIDCFDGRPVCWGVSEHPDKRLMVGMLEGLVDAVRPTEARPLVLHSDGGSVYMGDEWAATCAKGHVTRSMSRKARSPDNARREGFFGTLKSDFFEGEDWTGVTFEEFRERLDAYIEWYRDEKIKKSLGWRTTAEYRRDLGFGHTLAA